MKCMICGTEAHGHMVLHRFMVAGHYFVICEHCLPDLYAECSRIVAWKSSAGAHAADSVLRIKKKLDSMEKDDEELS